MNENNKNIVDSLSEFLNVVSVIQSQAAAVENISGASKTLNNIIKNINKFPNNLGTFDSDVVKNTLNNISSAVRMLNSTNSDINKALKDSIFNPKFFDNSIFKETERFANPSLIESIKNLAAQNGQTVDVNTFEKEKVNLYIENFLTTMKYTNQVFTAVKSFLNMCNSMKDVDVNNTGVDNVTSIFKKSLMSIKLIVGYISNIMEDPIMANILDYIGKFQSEVNAYEGREAELMYLQEKMSRGKLDEDDSKRLNDHYKSKPTNIFECLTTLYGSVLEILKSINQFNKIEPANPAKLLWNLQISVWNLNIVIRKIPEILSLIDKESLIDIAIKMSPKTIETVNGTTATRAGDTTVQNTATTRNVLEQMSPFDLIKHIFDMIEGLNNIKVVNPIKVWLAINMLSLTFKMIRKGFKTIISQIVLLDTDLTNTLKTSKESTDSIKSIFDNIKSIIDNVLYIAKWCLIATPAMIPATLFILALKGFINLSLSLLQFKEDAINKSKENSGIFSNIVDILKSICQVMLLAIALSVIGVVAMPALVTSTLFIGLLVIFIKAVNVLVKNINAREVLNIQLTFKEISNIIKNIVIIAASVIILALVAIVATPALLISIVFVLLLTSFVVVLNLLLKVINIKAKDIFTLVILGLFISLLIVVSYMVLKLSEIGSKINWLGLLASVGAILLVSIIAIAIGFAASTIFPILGVSILGMLGVIALVGLLTLTAVLLKELQEFTLDKQALNDTITTIFDTVRNIISNIFKPDDTKEEKSNKTWFGGLMEQVGGKFSALKSISEAILTIPFLLSALISIGCLYLIANLLSKISEIQISEDIDTKISEIIGTAKHISEIITRPVKQASGENGEETKLDKFKNFVGNTGLGRRIGVAVEIMKNIGSTGILASIIPNIMMLSTVVDLIKSINELVVPSDINNKVTSIIEATKLVSDQVGESSNIQSIDEDKVKVFGKYVDDSVKYFKHINKLDVSKIKSLNEMYDKMGQFMDKLQDAPIGEIADALVNKISPALSDINNNLDKQSNPTQQTTQQPVVQQVPQNTQQVQQVDYTSILENIEDLLSNIKQKLNNNPQIAF